MARRHAAGRRRHRRAAAFRCRADQPDRALHRQRRRQAHPPAPGAAVRQCPGLPGTRAFTLAAIVEFIHTATLLHDDVVDESSLRRGRKTANAVFGNAASVLVGDFLYSRAFQMMVSVDRMRVLDVLADATNVIAEGEVLQLMNMHDADLAVEDYLRVIRYKTAKLFEASARLGAVLAGAPTAHRGGLRRLRPIARHGVPAGRRPARLRRRPACSSARTSATTCAKASPRCRCWWRWSARGVAERDADPPRHRARRGRPAARHRRRSSAAPARSKPRATLRATEARQGHGVPATACRRRMPRRSARIVCSVGRPLVLTSSIERGAKRLCTCRHRGVA